jgi:hypothetical protein
MQEKVGALGLQLAQEVQQVDQRPAQPIHRPRRTMSTSRRARVLPFVVVIFIGVVEGDADIRQFVARRCYLIFRPANFSDGSKELLEWISIVERKFTVAHTHSAATPRMRRKPWREVQLNRTAHYDRISLLSSVGSSRWTSNHYFRPAMYDLS